LSPRNFKKKTVSLIVLSEWPPSSPDCNLMDYYFLKIIDRGNLLGEYDLLMTMMTMMRIYQNVFWLSEWMVSIICLY